MDKKGLLSIHEFAEVCRTTPRTVRFYEQQGLIKPAFVDPFTKYRYYEKENQAREFLRLRLLHNFHVSLKAMKEMVQNGTIEQSLDIELKKRKDELIEREKEFAFLKHMKLFLYDEESLDKYLKRQYIGVHTLFIRKFPKVEFEKTYLYCREVQKDAKRLKINVKDEYFMFYQTRYYKPKASYVEIGLICKSAGEKKKPIPEGYSFRDFPKTKVLAFTYKGPFTYFMLLYKKLNDYVDAKKLVKGGTSIDYYLKYQVNSTSEYDYLTKICFPI